jgi:hypothetical protein
VIAVRATDPEAFDVAAQERGSFRQEYEGSTLRDHLGLHEPVWEA